MAYTFKQNMLASSKHSLKCPNAMTPEGVCIHNTANDATAANEISYMIGNDISTSYHVAVDDKEVIQAVPFDRNCWASGDGNGNGNRKHIHIEICYSKSGGAKFTEAEQNAAAYTAKLLKERGWNVSKVKKHQDFAAKYCPHRTLDLGWQRFINMIQTELDKLNGTSGKTTNPSDTTFKVGEYNGLVETTSDLNVRSARNATSSILVALPKGTQITVGYIMYENNKTTGTTLWGGVTVPQGQGFIHLGYVKPISTPTVQYYPMPSVTTLLIAALDAIKVDSSLANREKIAKANSIANYTGSVEQDTKIFDLLKQGVLIKG